MGTVLRTGTKLSIENEPVMAIENGALEVRVLCDLRS